MMIAERLHILSRCLQGLTLIHLFSKGPRIVLPRLAYSSAPSRAVKTKNVIVRCFWHTCIVYFHFMVFYGILNSLS